MTTKSNEATKTEKYPTVYINNCGTGRAWAIFQCLTMEEAQAYVDQFDDNREIRMAKYNPERKVFTNGKGWREYGVRSSKQLRALKSAEARGE